MALKKKKLEKAIKTMKEDAQRMEGILDTLDDLAQDPHKNKDSIENWLQYILATLESTENTLGMLFEEVNS
jgi:hypothetical protein